MAHQQARVVSSARGRARSSCCSVNALVEHLGSSQRQVRLRHTNGSAEGRGVDQDDVATAAAAGDHATVRAAHRSWRRLHDHPQPSTAFGGLDDVEALEADEEVAAVAVGGIWT